MADGYLDIVIFQEGGRDGKKKPKTIGWAKLENGEAKGRIELMPTHGWDGSFKIQERRERQDAGSHQQSAPRTQSNNTNGNGGARPVDDDDNLRF